MQRSTHACGAWRTLAVAAVAAAPLLVAGPAQARVTSFVIDSTTQLGGTPAYQQLRGRAFGTLDPTDSHNTIITDLQLGKSGDGLVHYETTFTLTVPVNLAQASGFMWHDVPNRGGAITIVTAERGFGDIGLASGWQADNAGATAIPAIHSSGTNHWVSVPYAKNADGSPVTGTILGRIVNRSGVASEPLLVMGNPIPYLPATLDTSKAVLMTHTHETIDGNITLGTPVASSDWAFAHCDASNPFPGTAQDINPMDLPGTLPVHVCLKNGFDPKLLYQLVYPAQNAWLLGVGIAAFRDVNSFFRYSTADDTGQANPIAGLVKWAVIRGVSQSGNFTRQYIDLGFNQDESGRIVHEGAWPIIAGRRVAADVRWGQPDGVLELYQLGSEGPQWWSPYNDVVRGEGTHSILDRCNATGTCPKIIEHFGGSEVFALKMTTSWVGTSANSDIPLPRNVRRYYIPSTTHGGGSGGFNVAPSSPTVNCPGNNWGTGTFGAEPGLGDGDHERAARRDAQLVDDRRDPAAEPLSDADRRQPRAADAGRDGLPVRRARRAGVDLPAGELRQPGVRLRLGYAIQPRRRDRRADELSADDPARRSRCACRGSMRTATSSAACRRCCATRRSGPISAGTSRRPASTRARSATTSAAISRSRRRRRSASPTATRGCRCRSATAITPAMSPPSRQRRTTRCRRVTCCRPTMTR